MKITAALKREMETDINLCNEHTERNGSMSLYNDLVAKYVVIDSDFEKGLSIIGKATVPGQEFDFRPELKAIANKLHMWIVLYSESDEEQNTVKVQVDELIKRGEAIGREEYHAAYQVTERHIGKEKFRIVSVDSCLFLDERASQHNLSIIWPELEKLAQQIKNDEYINIMTMHHSLDCFEPNSRNRLRKWIEDKYIDLVFCGHSVVKEVNTNISTQSHIQQFYSGIVPFGDNLTPNFWICQYEAGSTVVEMSLYTYSQKGMIFKSCLWNGDSYHYQILRKKENGSSFLKKSDDILKTRKGSIRGEKLLFKEINACCKAIRNILNEPYNINNSTSRSVSPDGVLWYNRLANKFNLFFPEAEMFIFREDTTPNLVTHPKTQEILYQLEYALEIIIDDLNQKREYIVPHQEETTRINKIDNNRVFVVYGHDEGAKQTVARFLEQCGFVPVILHEQADGGKTIIEKIEQYADVIFAIILYTPCDIGRDKNEKRGVPRARQNVVFEHGYLIGKLGRERVCALVKQGVQTPGDMAGVIYKSMDSAGAWKTEILREMKSAGIVVDAGKLL